MTSQQETSPAREAESKLPEEVGGAIAIVALVAYAFWRWGHGRQLEAKLVALRHHVLGVLPELIAIAFLVLIVASIVGLLLIRHVWKHRLVRRVLSVFADIGIKTRTGDPPKLKVYRSPSRWVHEMAFRMPPSVSSTLMSRIQPNLQEHLDAGVKVWSDRGLIWLRIGTHQMPRLLRCDELRREGTGTDAELPVAVGVSREGPMTVDLAEIPHLLVGGTTGGGKSVFLNNLITGLITALPPARLRLVLIDLKGGLEFWRYREVPHLLCPVARDVREVMGALRAVLTEFDRRYPTFLDAGCEQLKAWNATRPDEQLPYLILVVDELAEATAKGSPDAEEQAMRKKVVAALGTIGRMGRALGIHMVLCTQRPDVDVLPGQIKGVMGATIAFRARDAIQSEVLLGQGDVSAAMLPKDAKGRAYYKGAEEGVMVQTPLVTPDEVDVVARRIVEQTRSTGAGSGETVQASPDVSARSDGSPVRTISVPTNDRAAENPQPKPRKPWPTDRLHIGWTYLIELSDGRSVKGSVRDTAYPQGKGGANADGEHTFWISDGDRDWWLSPFEVSAARRCPPGQLEQEEKRSA
ncbi:MAG: hypothetical protein LBV60_05020 [Streptomyces sp.]|nr:hypothetical protein [Streptomyces sp.]